MHGEEGRIKEVVLDQFAKTAWGAMQTNRPPSVIFCYHVRARHQVIPELGGALRFWKPAHTEEDFMY